MPDESVKKNSGGCPTCDCEITLERGKKLLFSFTTCELAFNKTLEYYRTRRSSASLNVCTSL